MTLTQAQMEALRAAIDQRRLALEAELDRELALAPVASPSEADEADAARDREELRELEAAAARMVEGSYGACVECGVAIPYPRLRAAPHAARCIDCQRKQEA